MIENNKRCFFVFLVASFVFLLAPQVGFAQTDFLGYAMFFYPLMLSAAAILAVVMLAIAGIEMMTGSVTLREDAKRRAWAAILGLLLAVLTYLILFTINPQLVGLILTLPTP